MLLRLSMKGHSIKHIQKAAVHLFHSRCVDRINYILSLLLYPRLPNELPMQFSLSGEVNRTMNKEFAIWCIPVLEAVILMYTDRTDNRIAGLAIAILLTIIQLGIMLLFMR